MVFGYVVSAVEEVVCHDVQVVDGRQDGGDGGGSEGEHVTWEAGNGS